MVILMCKNCEYIIKLLCDFSANRVEDSEDWRRVISAILKWHGRLVQHGNLVPKLSFGIWRLEAAWELSKQWSQLTIQTNKQNEPQLWWSTKQSYHIKKYDTKKATLNQQKQRNRENKFYWLLTFLFGFWFLPLPPIHAMNG